jgi:hypothetical protein
MSHPSRRSFLHSTTALLGAAAFAAPFESFTARLQADEKVRHAADFGKLAPVKDKTTGLPLIQLPDGFEYLTFGWEKDKLTDGGITPSMHDGMAVIAHDENTVTLCRNHEVDGSGKSFGSPEIAYDPAVARILSSIPRKVNYSNPGAPSPAPAAIAPAVRLPGERGSPAKRRCMSRRKRMPKASPTPSRRPTAGFSRFPRPELPRRNH